MFVKATTPRIFNLYGSIPAFSDWAENLYSYFKDKHPAMRGKIFSLDLGNVPTWLYRGGGRMTRFQGISTGLSFIGFTANIAPPNLLPQSPSPPPLLGWIDFWDKNWTPIPKLLFNLAKGLRKCWLLLNHKTGNTFWKTFLEPAPGELSSLIFLKAKN